MIIEDDNGQDLNMRRSGDATITRTLQPQGPTPNGPTAAAEVYLVVEAEPESEFPAVVLGAYTTRDAAEAHRAARIAQWEREHGDDYDDQGDFEVYVEGQPLRETFDPSAPLL